MEDWSKTRKMWLKELRKREPTWKVSSKSGQVTTLINVRVGQNSYDIMPAMCRDGEGFRYSVYSLTQRNLAPASGDILGQLIGHIKQWSKK